MNPNAQQQLNNNVGFPQPNNMLQNQPLENLNNQDHNLEHFWRPLLWRMLLGQPQGQQFPFIELWWILRIPGAAMPYPMMLAATYGIFISAYHYLPRPLHPRRYPILPMVNNHYVYHDILRFYSENGSYDDPDDQDYLDDHYQGHQRYSMDTVRGNVISVAKEHDGSVFLRRTLKDGSKEDINNIFLEMKTDLCSLMLHRFAKLVVMKLIDAVDHRKLDEIIDLLITDIRFNQICDDYHGTQVVKTLAGRLRFIPTKQSSFTSALSNAVLFFTRSANAGVVFCRCLKSFSPQYKQELATAIAENCLHIGQDSCGFRLMQKCLDEANDEIFNRLAPAIVQHADTLSDTRYGTFVVQHLIETKKLEVKRNLVTKLTGKFVWMSKSQHGSFVVQKLMRDSSLEEVVDTVVTEILDSSSSLQVSRDRYGNFVVQDAIHLIKDGPLFNRFKEHIMDNERQLLNHSTGKKVLLAMKARLANLSSRSSVLNSSVPPSSFFACEF